MTMDFSKVIFGTTPLSLRSLFPPRFMSSRIMRAACLSNIKLRDAFDGVVVGGINCGKRQLYRLHEVPRPWRKKLRFCIRLIDAVRRKTPKVVLEICGLYCPTSTLPWPDEPLVRCELMENGPLPDFVMHYGATMKLKVDYNGPLHNQDTRSTR